MNMFTNYNNIPENYVPNNLVCSLPVGKSYTKLDPIQASKPYEEYDAKGELIGYFWRYGETLNLEFNIDGEITVEDDAIVLTSAGQTPDNITGKILQKAYNVVDKKSWTCTSVINNISTWTEDEIFTYAENGESVYIPAEDFLKDKKVDVTIYNFRMEPIQTYIFEGTSKIVAEINSEISLKLVKGIYYCSLTVFNDKVNLPIFNSSDCTLIVK